MTVPVVPARWAPTGCRSATTSCSEVACLSVAIGSQATADFAVASGVALHGEGLPATLSRGRRSWPPTGRRHHVDRPDRGQCAQLRALERRHPNEIPCRRPRRSPSRPGSGGVHGVGDVDALRALDFSCVPSRPGAYVVLRRSSGWAGVSPPEPGRLVQGKDPSVPEARLRAE
jgi:hypothetical protein